MLNIPNTWRKISVVDLGYNSLKMVSYEIRYDGTFRAYNQMGELTKIGEGVEEKGKLNSSNARNTIEVLKVFNEVCRVEKIHNVLAIATSAIREAADGKDFVESAKKEADMDFRVLSAEEEALFSFVGCAKASKYPYNLFFDLGGGSLELVYSENDAVQKAISLPIGSLKLTEAFGVRDSKYNSKEYERLKAYIRHLLPDRNKTGVREGAVLTGVGGTLRAIARFDQKRKKYQFQKMHNYVLSRTSVREIHELLLGMSLEKISKISAFGKGRASSIVTGSLVIYMLMELLGFNEVTVSSHGLRDGILTEYLQNPERYCKSEYTAEMATSTLQKRRTENPRQQMIHSLGELGLLNSREETILAETMGNFMDTYLSTRPEAIFYAVMSQDSILSHGDQFAAALALVRAKSPKVSRWFQDTYASVGIPVEKKSISRMSSIIQLIEMLFITGSRAFFEKNEDSILMRVKPGNRKIFPKLLMDRFMTQFRDSTEIQITAEVT